MVHLSQLVKSRVVQEPWEKRSPVGIAWRACSGASRHETKWQWIRNHGSDPDQDRCDALAQESARSVAAGRTTGELAA